MTKLVYVDVRTHFGQELQSLFGSKLHILYPILRRVIGYNIFRGGKKLILKIFLNTKDNLISFIISSSSVNSWEKAHRAILNVDNKH